MSDQATKRKTILEQLEVETIEIMSSFINAQTPKEQSEAYERLDRVSRLIGCIERINKLIKARPETPEDHFKQIIETPE